MHVGKQEMPFGWSLWCRWLLVQIPSPQVDNTFFQGYHTRVCFFLTVHSAAGIAGFLATSHVPMVHALLPDNSSRQDVMIYRLTLWWWWWWWWWWSFLFIFMTFAKDLPFLDTGRNLSLMGLHAGIHLSIRIAAARIRTGIFRRCSLRLLGAIHANDCGGWRIVCRSICFCRLLLWHDDAAAMTLESELPKEYKLGFGSGCGESNVGEYSFYE